jgi:hypothetical protein
MPTRAAARRGGVSPPRLNIELSPRAELASGLRARAVMPWELPRGTRKTPTAEARRPGASGEPQPAIHPLQSSDARWVLALRTAEQLQGAILGPEKRERLLGLGRSLGLRDFDANLVIAIVQDQARRGHPARWCAAAGERQLAMVPGPAGAESAAPELGSPHAWRIACLLAATLAAELLAIYCLF